MLASDTDDTAPSAVLPQGSAAKDGPAIGSSAVGRAGMCRAGMGRAGMGRAGMGRAWMGGAGTGSGTALARTPDDKAMLRAAAELTRDLSLARGAIFWPDMLISACLGYAALTGAILAQKGWVTAACVLVSALTLYRALLFIHELSHIHKDALPGFRLGWNLLVGIPLLTPSFMYEGLHPLHHARTR